MNAQHKVRPRPSLVKGFFVGIWYSMITALALTGAAAMILVAFAVQTGLQVALPGRGQVVRAVESIGVPNEVIEPVRDRTRPAIYLNREGGVITAGTDDSSRNSSSVVASAGLEAYEVPEYRGLSSQWDTVMSCVSRQFEAYDVDVVDQRPVDRPYVMVMVGGRPGELSNATGHP